MTQSAIYTPVLLIGSFFVFCLCAEGQPPGDTPSETDGAGQRSASENQLFVAGDERAVRAQSASPPAEEVEELESVLSRVPDPVDSEDSPWGHFEVSMGFLAGQRHYDEVGFVSESSRDTVPRAAFQGAPYDRTEVFGLRYDVRLVVSYVRMTAGIDFPFTSFSPGAATRDTGDGVRTVDSLKSYALRFGIGAEYPVGPVAPFVDVMGAVHWIDTSLVHQGESSSYSATDFGFAARAGLRLQVRRWFFASVAAEVGIVGPVRWGAELSVGFALGPDE